jgi:toxin ParE1/3/4
MKEHSVTILSSAEKDLEEILDFIALDNPLRAISFGRELRGKAMDIGKYPLIFPALPEMPELRKRSFRGYIIIYKVKNDLVVIVHILNSMRDYALLLKKRKQT